MQERLSNARALAAFSPDALSSIAYANEEIYLALAVAAGLVLSVPIGVAIVALLTLVALSYFQTVHSYPLLPISVCSATTPRK